MPTTNIYNKTAEEIFTVIKGRTVRISATLGSEVGSGSVTPKEAQVLLERHPEALTLDHSDALGERHLFKSSFGKNHYEMLLDLTKEELTGCILFLAGGNMTRADLSGFKAEGLVTLARRLARGTLPDLDDLEQDDEPDAAPAPTPEPSNADAKAELEAEREAEIEKAAKAEAKADKKRLKAEKEAAKKAAKEDAAAAKAEVKAEEEEEDLTWAEVKSESQEDGEASE